MRSLVLSRAVLTRAMESTRGPTRYFSDSKGRVLSEEERAAENIYIQEKLHFEFFFLINLFIFLGYTMT
ncbi:hypothetical protein FEM48_Zijuj03G0037100 [Ziziphus jujuba var. spinosa]|uniref:Uncharacterized protein n=1 Tax=Ziziphus jujuba var. spinosa TaxID=714518 RepID=A0A978VMZ1_ZIZJJ|nr:hypothetical protein FEM48_Zijuj03G0037100 [Ziziphus jujuba var. spinosa]